MLPLHPFVSEQYVRDRQRALRDAARRERMLVEAGRRGRLARALGRLRSRRSPLPTRVPEPARPLVDLSADRDPVIDLRQAAPEQRTAAGDRDARRVP